MSLIHWMPENNTNIDFVDNQHRNIAGLINELERTLEANQNIPEAQRLIKKILNSSISHFAQEENLMEQHNVPDLKIHENEHYFFEDTVCAVEDAVKANDISLAQEKLQLLSDWFVDHIKEMDQDSLQYVKGNNAPVAHKKNNKERKYRGQDVGIKDIESSASKTKLTSARKYRGQNIS